MDIKTLQSLSQNELFKLIRALEKDYSLFAKVAMSHIVKDMPTYQKEVYSLLNKQRERKFKYSAFVLSRGLAKSTMSKTIQVTSDVVFAKEAFPLLLSESIDQSVKDLSGVKDEIVHNEFINVLAGNLKGSIWNNEEVEFANGVYSAAKGYGSRIRGIKWKTQRPTKVILDDFESENNTRTTHQRNAVENWLDAQVLPAGEPKTVFQFWGTIVHPKAFLAQIKNLPYFQPPKGVFYRKDIEEGGIPAWPSRFPMDWIEDTKNYYSSKNRLSFFLQEYYNIARRAGDLVFNVDQLPIMDAKFENYDYITYLRINGQKVPVNVFIGVDPARSLRVDADDTAYFVIGVLPSNKIVLLECITEKSKPNQQVKKIFELVRKWHPVHVEVEVNAYQFALADWCRTKINEGWQPAFPIREYDSRSSKNKKYIAGLEPYINGGYVSRIKNMSGWDVFRSEATEYDGGSTDNSDNSLDGLFLALNSSYAPQDFNVDEVITNVKTKQLGKSKKRKLNWMTI